MEQAALLFETELTTEPVSQIPKPAQRGEASVLIEQIIAILPELPDDIALDDCLAALAIPRQSLTGWHRARALDALVGGPYPHFQAYIAERFENGGLKLRYRRLPPLMPCPGYGDFPCGKPTVGGKRCVEHAEMEEIDLWDQP